MNLATHYPVLQVVIPMLLAPLTMLMPSRLLAWLIATATSLCAFAIAIAITQLVLAGDVGAYPLGGWPAPFGIELRVDALSALLLLLISGASSAALLAGYQSLAQDIDAQRANLFFAAWLLALAGLCGIVVAGDAFNIFVFMEISSLASYILVAASSDRRALPAVFKYLVMGTIGATFYLIGVGLLYIMTGTLNLADLTARIPEVTNQTPIFMAAGFISVGLALKAAIFPLHAWLPNTYSFAPHAVTAFLAACSTKVALYVFLRVDFFVFQGALSGHGAQFAGYLMPMAVAGILFGSAIAIREPLVKRLFAWSSVAQVGYIALGASLLSHTGLSAALLHMFNHALAKGAIFLAIIVLAMRAGGVSIEHLKGLGRQHPVLGIAFTIAGLSLIGIPGTAGFISKWFLIQAILEHPQWSLPLLIIVLASSLMAVVYVAKVAESLFFQHAETQRQPLPLMPMTIVVIASAANIAFGLAPQLPVEIANAAASLLLEQTL